jgi:hypothetical protein
MKKDAAFVALRRRWGVVRLLCLVTALSLCPAGAEAEGPAAKEKLPSGEEIVERSIEAAGGREALAKITNRVAEGTLEIKGMGIKGTLITYQARPNKTYSKVDIEGIGSIEQGTDGKVVWELHPMTGPRIQQGAERAAMLLLSHFDETTYKERYEKIECVGTEDVDGEVCYKVVLTPKEATPLTTYYSKQSGLPLKVVLTFPHQFGKIKIESTMSDYREVDGILLPHQTVEKVLAVEARTKVTSYKHNVDLPEDRFRLPPEIKALIERGRKKEKETPAGQREA